MAKSINPANNEILKEYETMTLDEVMEIAKASEDAFSKWKSLSIKERMKQLSSVAELLRKNKEEYAKMMTLEMGKITKESVAEVEKCAWLIDELVANSENWMQEETIDANGKEHLITHDPLGPIYIIMPWNFPFWQVFKVGMPQLAAGNTIILKHSSNVSGSALLIEEIFKQAEITEDVFRTVLVSHDSSEALIKTNEVKGVSVTGSVDVGRTVAKQAGEVNKKTVLELGGSDPFIVLEDANIDAAVNGAVTGRMLNCGQVCIGAKRFIVHENVYEEFTNKFKAKLEEMKIGDPMDTENNFGPMVNSKAVDQMIEFVEDATSKGATLLHGGNKLDITNGAYFEPTLLTDITEEMKVFTDETFGPIAPVISFSTEEEAIRMANNSEFGLNASIWSEDLDRATELARQLDTGGVFVNNFSQSHPLLPLGGIKNSGYGRELSKYGIKEFINLKPINVYETKGD